MPSLELMLFITTCCFFSLLVLLYIGKKKTNGLNKQIVFLKEKEKLVEKEFRALEDIIYQKTIELEEQRNLTFHASKMSALGEMAGGIAHEINNPMTIINSANRKLRKLIELGETDHTKLYKYCDNIDHTVVRITKIITALINVSRDASNEDFKPVKLIDIFEDILYLFDEKFKLNGVELRIDLKDKIYQTIIICNRIQLAQVFWNLLGNSYDSIENLLEKWIQIDCLRKENKLFLRFSDSGPGIPGEIKDKIFQPFFTTKEIGKGIGLGLSLSNSIIKNHKGELYVDSNNKNTCFVINLPVTETND